MTRTIIMEWKRKLPFTPAGETKKEDVEMVNEQTKTFIKSVEKFLKLRNQLIHHIGSPKKSVDDIEALCERIFKSFDKCMIGHRAFFETAGQFRFSEKEILFFYGSGSTR